MANVCFLKIQTPLKKKKKESSFYRMGDFDSEKQTCPGFPAISHRDRVLTRCRSGSEISNHFPVPHPSLPPSLLQQQAFRSSHSSRGVEVVLTTERAAELIWHLKDLHLKVGFLPPAKIITFSKWMLLFLRLLGKALDTLENWGSLCLSSGPTQWMNCGEVRQGDSHFQCPRNLGEVRSFVFVKG